MGCGWYGCVQENCIHLGGRIADRGGLSRRSGRGAGEWGNRDAMEGAGQLHCFGQTYCARRGAEKRVGVPLHTHMLLLPLPLTGASFVPAREWMRICFELLEMLKAHKKAIRRATVNTFGYIAKAIGPQVIGERRRGMRGGEGGEGRVQGGQLGGQESGLQ